MVMKEPEKDAKHQIDYKMKESYFLIFNTQLQQPGVKLNELSQSFDKFQSISFVNFCALVQCIFKLCLISLANGNSMNRVPTLKLVKHLMDTIALNKNMCTVYKHCNHISNEIFQVNYG